jgi:hypothetical protein
MGEDIASIPESYRFYIQEPGASGYRPFCFDIRELEVVAGSSTQARVNPYTGRPLSAIEQRAIRRRMQVLREQSWFEDLRADNECEDVNLSFESRASRELAYLHNAFVEAGVGDCGLDSVIDANPERILTYLFIVSQSPLVTPYNAFYLELSKELLLENRWMSDEELSKYLRWRLLAFVRGAVDGGRSTAMSIDPRIRMAFLREVWLE